MTLRNVIAFVALATVAVGQHQKPDPKRLRADARQLDELHSLFLAKADFDERFWRASKRIADARGPTIIHALMDRARQWKGEEALVYVPLVALLPREPTLKLLKHYEQSERKSDRIHAREFQVELESDDVNDAVREYSKPKKR